MGSVEHWLKAVRRPSTVSELKPICAIIGINEENIANVAAV